MDIESILAIVLSLSIPIVAIIGGIVSGIKKKNREIELRKMIIENNVDAERIKMLVEEHEKKGENKFVMLRWGCILSCAGLTIFICLLMFGQINTNSILFWFLVAFGMGIGMLISFLIEMHMTKKEGDADEGNTETLPEI